MTENKRGQDLTEHARAAHSMTDALWPAIREWFVVESEDETGAAVEDWDVVDAVDKVHDAGGITHNDVINVSMAMALTDVKIGGADASRSASAWLRVATAALKERGTRVGADVPVSVPEGVTPQVVEDETKVLAVADGKGGLYVVGKDEGDDI